MKYCNECVKFFQCRHNKWVVTMDKRRKYEGEYCCDNFETEHWGVWNDVKKEFQFDIDESSKSKAKQMLCNKIGYDNISLGFSVRKLPKENYKRIIE